MEPARRVSVVAVALGAGAVVFACHDNADCTCTVDQSGDHRVFACGDTACVGGLEFTCSDGTARQAGGGCTSSSSGSSGTGGDAGGPSSSGGPADHSCDDLSAFCNTSCRKPSSVSADCFTTAGNGDPAACAAWQSSNSVLCSP